MSARRVELTLALDVDEALWPVFAASPVGASTPELAADVADWLVEVVSISRGASCGAVELISCRDTTLLAARAEQLGLDLSGGQS